MANPNFSAPAISNKIASDIDSIRELAKLIARLRGDLADNAPDGTIIFNQTAMNFQMKNGTVWSALDDGTGKYAFNVDKLDGFHANAGIIANSIVVRDSKGVIPGNISGRAPNATQADELTTVNPIAKGGTGASTAAQARANLGTNDVGNLTAGVLPFERGGTGRTDGSAQDVQINSSGEGINANLTTAKGCGQLGLLALGKGIGTDANLFIANGNFWFNNEHALTNFPINSVGGILTVRGYYTYARQEFVNYNNTGRYWRLTQNSGSTWTPWYRVPEGLTDNYTTNSSVVAASAKALMNLKAYADTKLPLVGGSMSGRINELRGKYISSWETRCLNSGINIRENDLVSNTQSDIGYAPSIGFLWDGKASGTLHLQSDGTFSFKKQYGERATVDCYAVAADLARTSQYLRNAGDQDMRFYWDGQAGQPQWLWGSNDGVNIKVWNPSNFSVNYANSCNWANNAGQATPTIYATWQSHGQANLPAGGTWLWLKYANYPDRNNFCYCGVAAGGSWIGDASGIGGKTSGVSICAFKISQ